MNFIKLDLDKRFFRGFIESEYNVLGTGYFNMCILFVFIESKNFRIIVVGGLLRGGNIEEIYSFVGKGVNNFMKKLVFI